MPYRDVPAFVAKLRETPTTSLRALELTILTAARSGEIMGARWGEFDLVDKLWTVPADRMKAKAEHRVPLTPRMLAILDDLRPDKVDPMALVLPGARPGRPTDMNRSSERPLSSMALAMALRRAWGTGYTVHGFRSSFRDWVGDETAFPREVAEAALAHTIKDATERAYCRATALEKRRELMRAWGSFLDIPHSGNVVPIAERRA